MEEITVLLIATVVVAVIIYLKRRDQG